MPPPTMENNGQEELLFLAFKGTRQSPDQNQLNKDGTRNARLANSKFLHIRRRIKPSPINGEVSKAPKSKKADHR
jgi:hypothetical protein